MTERYGGAPVGGAATSVVPADVENFFDKYSQGMRVVVEGAQADTGRTPKEVVWTRNKARLYRYEPSAEKKHPVPILIVYALINRPYVLDLLPGNSFVEYLTSEGFDVYLLDWGSPATRTRTWTSRTTSSTTCPAPPKRSCGPPGWTSSPCSATAWAGR
jgi:hypothetical protein